MLNRGQQSKQPKVPDANNTTTLRLDMSSAPGVWTTGPAFTQGRADFGLAYDAGTNKLYALGGDTTGGGFFDSTNLVDELSVASWPAGSWAASPPNLILPNRQANQAGFYGSGQIWSVGGIVGQTFQFLAEVQRRSNGSGPCGTPTATPTPTAPATATPTATAGTPSPTPTCPPGNSYTIAQIGGSIVPGTTDIGNHGDDTVTTIALPFSYTLYDQTFTSINLSSNGNAQFTTTDATFTNQCLPWLTHNYSIYPYWDDLYLVNSGFGIFTSISGTAPNRIFNIEWRAQYFPGSGSAGFELRLYEGQTRFDVIYGTVTTATHRPQLECRRTTPPLRSISATARAARLLADKATRCKAAARRHRRLPGHHREAQPARRVRSTCLSPIPIPPCLRSCRARSWPSQG